MFGFCRWIYKQSQTIKVTIQRICIAKGSV